MPDNIYRALGYRYGGENMKVVESECRENIKIQHKNSRSLVEKNNSPYPQYFYMRHSRDE